MFWSLEIPFKTGFTVLVIALSWLCNLVRIFVLMKRN